MAKLTEAQLRLYLERFLDVYQETASSLLTRDELALLRRFSLLPSTVIGIISQTYGVGIEYVPASETSVKVWTGYRSIEDLLLHPPARVQKFGLAFAIEYARRATIADCSTKDIFPFRLKGKDTSVLILGLRCVAGEWSRYIHLAELYGNSDEDFWTLERATNEANREILVAVLDAKRARERELSVSDYIQHCKAKTVLVLGSYSAEAESRLRLMSIALARQGYEPVLLKDLLEYPAMDLRQKAVIVGGVARFVVIDDSEASGHLIEFEALRSQNFIIALMHLQGSHSTYMSRGADVTSTVIKEFEYPLDSLADTLLEATRWAEARIEELARKYTEVYPWRPQQP